MSPTKDRPNHDRPEDVKQDGWLARLFARPGGSQLAIFLLLILVGIVSGFLKSLGWFGGDQRPPEAAAVVHMLEAIRNSDVEGFKNAHSQRIREHKDQSAWQKDLKEAQALWWDVLVRDGGFMRETEWSFTGDSTSGKATAKYRGREIQFRVIKEGEEWKIDGR